MWAGGLEELFGQCRILTKTHGSAMTRGGFVCGLCLLSLRHIFLYLGACDDVGRSWREGVNECSMPPSPSTDSSLLTQIHTQ
jgi:hypothetical protein